MKSVHTNWIFCSKEFLTFSAIATGATNAEVDEEADGAVTRRKRFAWKLDP